MEATVDQTTPTDRQTFVIGDVHGHVDRLKALLEAAKVGPRHTVIQLGDLGHYGITGNGMADFNTWVFAKTHIDYVLWGNHDYAVFNSRHAFGGYVQPFPETYRIMNEMLKQERIRFALTDHGFLLTHAGLAKAFKVVNVDPALKKEPWNFARWTERCSKMQDPPETFVRFRDNISGYRGGGASFGGFIWRDAREKLYPGFRQIFGHTAKDNRVRKYPGERGMSYCIDIGTQTNGRLAGIWLPSEEVIDIQVLA